MTFKRGDWVDFQNGHGLHGGDYEGTGKVHFVRALKGDDELFLEDHDGIGSGIQVWAKDCKLKGSGA